MPIFLCMPCLSIRVDETEQGLNVLVSRALGFALKGAKPFRISAMSTLSRMWYFAHSKGKIVEITHVDEMAYVGVVWLMVFLK